MREVLLPASGQRDTSVTESVDTVPPPSPSRRRLDCLRALERKVLWLAVWMIHHANHVRPARDGLKVGGHQASSASMVTLMTALYFEVARPADRIAVKPHGSPVYHAIQYLFGRQTRDQLERFRALGGAQSYPSRTKDADNVDFSTGSMGLGVAMTSFAALVQEYVRAKGFGIFNDDAPPGRMIALAGDAEFDEGNVFEALLEAWKHRVGNVWWIIDYNRQSLDAISEDRMCQRLDGIFTDMEWRVVTIKDGTLLERAFTGAGGGALREWIDSCANSLYSALAYQGGAAWRRQLTRDLGDASGIPELLDTHDDARLQALMTNLAGHDLESVLGALDAMRDEVPTCLIAYTIKGYGLPLAGHKDNHAGMLTPKQMEAFQGTMGIANGEEWERFAGLDVAADELEAYLGAAAFNQYQPAERNHVTPRVRVPDLIASPPGDTLSTQQGFGRLLTEIARDHPDLAERIVTTSPDVTVSTNLGGWVNRRGVFDIRERVDAFRDGRQLSAQDWSMGPAGQHIELGIAENNLFILLAALGLSGPLFGARLLPIGTLYDPFINRGLDALNYACYQDARFIVVATPSGVSLAAEGGAHQSVGTPLIGIGQPGLTSFEPAYVDELSEILRWSLAHIQADDGESVYLRLSTRPVAQRERVLTPELRGQIVDGGYWLVEPGPGAEVAIVASGAVVPDALDALTAVQEDIPEAGLLVVTSTARLHRGWVQSSRQGPLDAGRRMPHAERLLRALPETAALVTVVDAHPATLSWLGSVRRNRVVPLGVDRFGQSGDLPDLYRTYGLDADAILGAVARAWTLSD